MKHPERRDSTLLVTTILSVAAVLAGPPCAAQVVSTPDPSFGTAGVVVTDLGSGEKGTRVVVQPDGKTVVVGAFNGGSAFLVARYGESGTLDGGFGTGGVVSTPGFGDSSLALDVLLRADGKVVAFGSAGNSGSTYITVARYEIDGATDTSYNNPLGFTQRQISAASVNNGVAGTLRSGGRMVVAATIFASTYDFALLGYTDAGVSDNSFGIGGIVTTDLAGDWDFAHDMALQTDGKIVVVGRTRNVLNSEYDIVVARYTSAGVLDSTFDSDGVAITSIGGYDAGKAVALQPDGKIIVVGISSGSDLAVLRYQDTGTLDSTFGSGGVATMADAEGLDVDLLPDGRILVAGSSWDGDENDLAVFCLLPGGTFDTGFDGDGMLVEDLGFDDVGWGVDFMHDGRFVVSGTAQSATDDDVVVLRYLGQSGEMIFWDGFESGTADWWSSAVGF